MDDLRDKYIALIADAADESALEDLRVQAVGKKGEISLQMRALGKMTPEERQHAGPALNALKDEINSALAAKKAALADAALDERLKEEWLDVTLPGARVRRARSTRSARSPKRLQRSLPIWASRSQKGHRSRAIGYNFRCAQHPGRASHPHRDGYVLHAPGSGR